MTDAAAVAELLDERPDLEPALQAALAADREHDSWTFDDVDVDSGSFGELVGRDVVVDADDGGYRLADPAAVERALSGETGDADEGRRGLELSGDIALPEVDRVAAAALAGVLALLAALRMTSLPAVFRDRVVLSSNDPYYYRYWVDQLLAGANGTLDLTVLSNLPPTVGKGEPLMVATMWLVTTLLGGTQAVGGVVLALYPVVSAVVTGWLVYLLALRVSDDRRVALAAVAMLAVIPAHGLRTSLGFADHHAFDYPWLVLTALGLVTLLGRERLEFEPRDAWPVLAVGLGVSAQVLAWEAGPLLVLPLGLVVAAVAPLAVREDRSVLPAGVPLVAGLALATLLAHLGHAGFGWHTDQVAYAPALLLVGVVGVLGAAEAFRRQDLPAVGLIGAEAVGAVGGAAVAALLLPSYWGRFVDQAGRLVSNQPIAEVQSLFAGPLGVLLLFGFALLLAVPYMAWGAVRGYRGDRRWLAVAVYAWYFLLLTVLQVRFGGELASFAAVFAGLGFVHLAERVDITTPPVPFRGESLRADGGALPSPTRQQVGAIVALFLLVGSLGLLQVPVKTSQLTIDEGRYETASFVGDKVQQEGIEYPDSYVFSEWGRNRMHNYFASGEARSYTFARERYGPFLSATSGEAAWEQLDGRRGYVVTTDREGFEPAMVQIRLHQHYGSAAEGVDGLGRYRAVYASEDGRYKAFRVVEGATIAGAGAARAGFDASTRVEVPGASFEYTRRVEANRYGAYDVAVANPGRYTINDKEVNISHQQVRDGEVVSLFEAEGTVYWSFDEAKGQRVYDRAGSNHLSVKGGEWIKGQKGGALAFDGSEERAIVNNLEKISIGSNESATIDFYISGDLSNSTTTFPRVFRAGDDTGNVAVFGNNTGERLIVRVTDDEGEKWLLFDSSSTTFSTWTRFTLVVEREEDEIRLYRDGNLADSAHAPDLRSITIDDRIALGDNPDKSGYSKIAVDEFRIYKRARSL